MGAGGIGAFAQGFATGFQNSLRQRRLREQMDLDALEEERREKRLNEQFQQQQELREKQFEALQEYRTRQGKIQERQLELQQRSADFQAAGAWEKVLDPTKPKAMRKFIFKQLSTSLGIDPKSQQFKDFDAMISGMDDDALGEIREALFAMIPDATPGQVTAFSRAIISGQMQMKDVVDTFREQQKSKRISQKKQMPGAAEAGTETETEDKTTVAGAWAAAAKPKTEEQSQVFTPEQLRAKAIELAQDDEINAEDVQLFITLARDLENSKKKNVQLKQIVTTDAEGNRVEKWATEEEILGDPEELEKKLATRPEAPSGRPVPTADEARAMKEAEATAASDIERLEPIHERADTARQMLPQVEAYRQLLRTGKFQTGSFAGLRESVGQVGRLLGIDQNTLDLLSSLKVGDPAIAEVLGTVSNQMALTFAGDVSRLTNMSLELIMGAVPSLLKTPEGNEIILEVYEAKGRQAIEIENLADQYIDQYKTLRPAGKPSFFEERNKILRQGILKSDFQERFLQAKKRGEGIDLTKLLGEGSFITLREADGDSTKFEVTGKTDKGVPLVRLRDNSEVPYVASPQDAQKLIEEGKWDFVLRQDPIKGPVLVPLKRPK